MGRLPAGTVTLLFSDIEGSTGLLRQLGPSYLSVLQTHRTILRDCWDDHGGAELGTEGDSFLVAFDNAPDAVRAAVQAQRRLMAEPWNSESQLRVRMGLHTGNPTPHDGGYVGMDVHRAARVAAAGHGGQILVTDATAALVKVDDIGFRDLGRHLLKDLPQAEHLFQVMAPGLPEVFPDVRSMGSTARLPRRANPLIGRDREIAELRTFLQAPDARLVTLTGPGGTGKTRLAIEVADQLGAHYPDGVYLITLETVNTADTMWSTIAAGLDVPPEGRIPPGLFDHLARRSALILLDNLEQISTAPSVVEQLLDIAPAVRLLATSRHPLHVLGEQEYPVPPLTVAASGVAELDVMQRNPAVQLFVQQARMVRPGFDLTAENARAVWQVCRALDGLPLAIELAAARSKTMSPAALVPHLDRVLDLRSDARPDRQRTLRETIRWSYDLLAPRDQQLLRRLAVFSGGADLRAVADVALDAPDLDDFDVLTALEPLIDASLVSVDDSADEGRIVLLNTVQVFARQELETSEEAAQVRDGAARYYHALTRDRLRERPEARDRFEKRLETELDNLRAALDWLLARPSTEPEDLDAVGMAREMAAELAGRLFWRLGYVSEGRAWCERALAKDVERNDTAAAECRTALGLLLLIQGDPRAAAEVTASAHEVLAEGARRGALDRHLANVLGDCLIHEATAAAWLGATDEAIDFFEDALRLDDVDDAQRARVGMNYAVILTSHGAPERSLALLEEAASLAENGGDPLVLIGVRHNKACALRSLGRADEARVVMAELFPLVVAARNPAWVATGGEDYAVVLSDLGEHESVALLVGASEAARERIGSPRNALQARDLEGPLARSRAALGSRWDDLVAVGRGMSVEQAMAAVGAVPPAAA